MMMMMMMMMMMDLLSAVNIIWYLIWFHY